MVGMASGWDDLASDVVKAGDGTRLHVRHGGEGPAVLLLHGFPQHAREWARIAPPLLAAGRRVVAPDLRGFGRSDKPLGGYDVGTVVDDVRAVAQALRLDRPLVVGHDLGVPVAYAWAAMHPEEVGPLVLVEASLADLPTWHGQPTWHPLFLAVPDLPEALIAGREAAFVAHLLRQYAHHQTTFSDEDVAAYARPLAEPGGLRGALAHIRAMRANAEVLKGLGGRPIEAPVLAIGAAPSFGDKVAKSLEPLARDVTGRVAEACGHWVPEERPDWLADQVLAFAGSR